MNGGEDDLDWRFVIMRPGLDPYENLLRELLPPGAAVVLLANPTNANSVRETEEIQAAARVLGLRLLILKVSSPNDIEAAFASIARQDISGVINADDPLLGQERDRIVALVARLAVPAIYSNRGFFEAGGLMSYGTDMPEGFRQAGVYTGRILKGEKPADLPVQQITNVKLYINLQTAKALGLAMPLPLLRRADEVIE
jgi:putative ABC transport system substrate-binding protein